MDSLDKDILDAITALANERFEGRSIVDVKVLKDVDEDGDEILKVNIVFGEDGKVLDTGATKSFVRYLRPRLLRIGVGMFPIMSYLSAKDAPKVAA